MATNVEVGGTLRARRRLEEYKQRIRSTRPKICHERACLVTESFKLHEFEEPALKRALALRDVLSRMSIYILDEELIVGNQASAPLAAPVFPEYSIRWLEEELDALPKYFRMMATRRAPNLLSK